MHVSCLVFISSLAAALPQAGTPTPLPTSPADAMSKGWLHWPCWQWGGSSSAMTPMSTVVSSNNANVVSAANTVNSANSASQPISQSDGKEVLVSSGTTGTSSGTTGGDGWYSQSALYSVSTPTPTLIPTNHWEHDPTDVQHLLPTINNQVYYSTDGVSSPKVAHQMAWMSANFTSPSVLLDQSTLVTYAYTPNSNSLKVSFKTEVAFKEAQGSWNAGAGLIMTVNDNACADGAFCYLKASSIVYSASTMSCIVSTVNINIQQAVTNMEVTWGHHRPIPKTGANNGNNTNSAGPQPSNPNTNTTASKDYTVGGDNNEDCVAPVDTRYGLKTACLGQYFDEDLDNEIGYQNVQKSSFASFLTQFKDLHYPDALPETNAKDKRWSLIPNFIKQGLAKVLPIAGVTTPYTKEISLASISMSVPQERTLVDSPWGQQVLIKSFAKTSTTDPDNQAKLDIYCVDCGMQGSADITGTVGISILDGISSLAANLRADMSMTLKVGVDASIVYSQTFEQQLFEVPLSPLCIADVICVGPYLKLGAEVVLSANAQGQLLAGASITMHNAQASVDIVQFTASASGWQPEFNPVLQASGSIDLSADVGLPLAIALGIDVLNGKFTKEVALVDRPGLVAEASLAVSGGLNADGSFSGGADETDGCTGIATSLTLKNEMYVSIPGRDNIMLSNPPGLPLASGCIALPANTATANSNTGSKVRRDYGHMYRRQNTTVTSTNQVSNTTTGSSVSTTTTTTKSSTVPTNISKNNSTSYGAVFDNTANILKTGTPVDTNYTLPNDFENAYTLTTNYEVATLVDSERRYQLLPCADGNIRLFRVNDTVPDHQCSDMFTLTKSDQVIVVDGMSRIIVYYPDEMDKTGVSRMRVVDVETVPIKSDIIVFVPATTTTDDGDPEQLYYPMDPAGDTFYAAVCKYADNTKPSTMFLVKDVTSGLQQLLDPALKFSITGGDVQACYYVPMVRGAKA